jgi:hypothetical protein
MNIRDRLNVSFLRALVRSPEGRRHVLSLVADAEHSGEARVFDAMLAYVGRADAEGARSGEASRADAQLARTIQKHRDDEIRHEALFRACIARQGVGPFEVPRELRIMDRLDPAVGGFVGRAIDDGRGVMEAYLILQVLEERAVCQFPLFVEAFDEVDPETARVFERVARDEERHLLYCQAIARRYAPDEATLTSTLARFRLAEARVFRKNQAANLQHVLARRYVEGAFVRAAWRLVSAVAGAVAGLPTTRFARAPRASGAPSAQASLA